MARCRFESESDACQALVEKLVWTEESNRLGTESGAKPLKRRAHRQGLPDGFDREYMSEWIHQFGVDEKRFDLSGAIVNGKYVVQKDDRGWAVWLEENGQRRHAAWMETHWDATMYILAMLRPRAWKAADQG